MQGGMIVRAVQVDSIKMLRACCNSLESSNVGECASDCDGDAAFNAGLLGASRCCKTDQLWSGLLVNIYEPKSFPLEGEKIWQA